jgi:DNA-binding response OmpR family regulator
MVYGVMERHEGKIEIESEPGNGTTFRLVFPVRKAAADSSEETGAGEALRPLRLLCIDDEPLVRELLKELLTREGHTAEVCDNGKTGVEIFMLAKQRGTPFDAVITDLGMPYFDGRQVARVIKAESPETPVIMLTGWGAFMKEDRETPSQVDGILSKPPRSRELTETLKRVMGSAKIAPPASVNVPSSLTS